MLFILFIFFKGVHAQHSDSSNYSLNNLVPPVKNLDEALMVDFEFFIEDVNTVREINMDFTADFTLKERWTLPIEACSEYSHTLKPFLLSKKSNTIIIPGSQVRKFWIPDTVLSNAKSVITATAYSETLRFRMAENGSCLLDYKSRKQAVVGCKMEFHQYPNDVQYCELRLRSYSYPVDVIQYKWKSGNKSLYLNEDVKLLQQELSVFPSQKNMILFGVNYSYIVVTFRFERRLVNALTQMYAPTFLIVILSWFAFWMGFDAIPARVSLGITSLLTVVTQGSSARLSLPKVSYVCAMDVWLLACMFFVFLTILEFTVANCLRIRKLKQDSQKKESVQPKSSVARRHHGKLMGNSKQFQQSLTIRLRTIATGTRQGSLEAPTDHPIFGDSSSWFQVEPYFGSRAIKNTTPFGSNLDLDRNSKIIFPLTFLLFNLVYWPLLYFRHF